MRPLKFWMKIETWFAISKSWSQNVARATKCTDRKSASMIDVQNAIKIQLRISDLCNSFCVLFSFNNGKLFCLFLTLFWGSHRELSGQGIFYNNLTFNLTLNFIWLFSTPYVAKYSFHTNFVVKISIFIRNDVIVMTSWFEWSFVKSNSLYINRKL